MADSIRFDAVWRLIGLCLLSLLSLWNVAQAASQASSLRFERINAFGSGSNPAMLQDRQGFIWVATQSGLHRYDGYRSKVFHHEPGNARSLPSEEIEALLEDADGRLWVGTRSGLARFEPETADFSLFVPAPEIDGREASRLIRDMVDDGRGGMWLATRGGVQHFDPRTGEFRSYRHEAARAESLVRDNVATLARDAGGGLWVATWPTGLDYLPLGSTAFQHFAIPPNQAGAPGVNVRALHVDSRKRLWIGTDFGIILWQIGSDWSQKTRLPSPVAQSDFRVLKFYEDREGTVWVGTLEQGLFRWNENEQKFQVFRYETDDLNSLPSNAIRSLIVDRSSTLWVGTLEGRLARSDLASRGFAKLSPHKLIPGGNGGNLTFAFADGNDGKVWVGGSGGVLLYDPQERKLLNHLRPDPARPTQSLSSNYVYHLYRSPDGPLWIATASGLDRFEPVTGKVSSTYFGDPSRNSINRIAPGKGGVLWLASGGGLIRFDPHEGKTVFYVHDPAKRDGRSFMSASSVLEDKAGYLWVIGGREVLNGGVDVLDPVSGKFINYRHDPQQKNSLISNHVSCLFEDEQGNVWLGTGNGISRARRHTDGRLEFTSFKGFESNNVTSIQADTSGILWVSTSAGLSSLDPVSGKIINFTASDGILEPGRLEGTSFRSKDGTIYFGGFGGVTIVNPPEVQRNELVPVVAITDISVLNRSLNNYPHAEGVRLEGSVTQPRSLILSWHDSAVAFEFAALHFADPLRHRYAYQLEGFDRDWIETSADRRVASYTNLDPGHYVFRVKAASKNGVWSDKEIALPLFITPPFWKTWWFQSLLAILLLGGLAAAYRWRIYQLTSTQARLEQQVEERTQLLAERERSKTRFLASASHDLRQPIQAINLFLCSLRSTPLDEGQNNLVRHLDASIKSLKGLLDSLLDVSKLDAGAIVPSMEAVPLIGLLEQINFELSPLALDKGLRFKLYFPQQDVSLNTDPQLIKVVLQNLVANAIAYTEHGGVLLGARRRAGYVDIEIWDTGIGIGEDEQKRIFDEFYQVDNPQRDRQKGLGLGLAIVKRTLALLQCTISCHSRRKRGTLFRVRVPALPDFVAKPAATSHTEIDARKFAGKHFVVVEDDDEVALSLMSWLKSIGGHAVRYASAEDALCEREQVLSADFVISDYRLPGSLSGIDFLNAVRHEQNFCGVLVTGDTSPEFIEKVRKSGWPVLFKPIDPEQLLRALLIKDAANKPPV